MLPDCVADRAGGLFFGGGRQCNLVDSWRPQLLGIGLDEAVSIIVQGSVATCYACEDRHVYFYDRRQPVVPREPEQVRLGARAEVRPRQTRDRRVMVRLGARVLGKRTASFECEAKAL